MPRSGSNTLTMVPSAPLACLLVSSLILFISFMSVPAVSGQTTFQYDNILLYRTDYDMKKCSYHFSTKTYGEVADGEFYFTTSGKLVANNVGQLGIKDLGASAPFHPGQIDVPPPSEFYRFGVEAKPRHVYLTPARRGEDNRYILFRINYLSSEGKALGLEYYVFETGTIIVQANQRASFTIKGPRTYSGEGQRWEKERTLVGTYTIVFDPISAFKTPPSQTEALSPGATLAFSADYEPVPVPEHTRTSEPPVSTPTPSTSVLGLPVTVVAALIGAFATVIAAYLGYRAVVKKNKMRRKTRK